MNLTTLKKELKALEKEEIIQLIGDLYKKVPEAKNYLNIYVTGDISKLAEKYRKQIEKYVFPYGRDMVLREKEARKLIRSVRKMKIHELNIELALHYVDCCLEVIESFGYYDDNYYIALQNMLQQAIKDLQEIENYKNYIKYIDKLSERASIYGIEIH